MKTPQLRIICGLFRSGTTFARESVQRAMHGPVLEEPLNAYRGLVNVPVLYPYVADGGGEYAALIDDVVSFSRPWKRTLAVYPKRWGRFKREVYRLAGDPWKLQWRLLRLAARLRWSPSSMLWKDPFATLAAPYLLQRYGARIVCMVRHPAAVWISLQRRGWSFDIGHLRRQPELLQAYGYDILPSHWEQARADSVAAIAILWKVMIRMSAQLAGKDGRFLIVKHEDLCRTPLSTVQTMVTHFGLELTPAAREFVIRCSQGQDVVGTHNRAHDFVRNSSLLVDDWRTRIAPRDEATMRDVIGDDLHKAYSRW